MSSNEIDTCGCPPTETTGAPGATAAGVHHVIINANDLERARQFYGWLMPKLGYPGVSKWPGSLGWFGPAGSFWVKQADPRFASDSFSKDRVGLCEIAFRAASRAQVDELTRELETRGERILDAPREYDYTPGYYAVFFADPDGIKLELVHIPA